MIFFNISFFSSRSSGTYSLEIRIVTSGDATNTSVIGNGIASFSNQSAAISNSVTTQFPNLSPTIPTPEALNASAVTSGKTRRRNTSFRAFN